MVWNWTYSVSSRLQKSSNQSLFRRHLHNFDKNIFIENSFCIKFLKLQNCIHTLLNLCSQFCALNHKNFLATVVECYYANIRYHLRFFVPVYRTRAIISRGLYTFLPHFKRPFMYCDLWPYVWLVFKSGF